MTRSAKIAFAGLGLAALSVFCLRRWNALESRPHSQREDALASRQEGYRVLGAYAAELRRHVGSPVPDIEFRLLSDGSAHRLEEFRGRVVLLNVWDTHCGPCRKEMPALLELQQKVGRQKLAVVTISHERSFEMERALSKSPLTLPPLSGYTKSLGWIPDSVVPITLFIDRAGTVREFTIGGRSEEHFETAVRRYI